jgi:hypothetical protein
VGVPCQNRVKSAVVKVMAVTEKQNKMFVAVGIRYHIEKGGRSGRRSVQMIAQTGDYDGFPAPLEGEEG